MIQTYKDITYKLARSERKTISIYIEPAGNIILRVPKDLQKNKIEAIIDDKIYWIQKSICEFKYLNKTKVSRQIIDGEGFLFMGNSYKLKIIKESFLCFKLSQNYFLIREDKVSKGKSLFIKFYKEKAKEYIPKRVDYFIKKIGVKSIDIKIIDLKNRWGSKTDKGINFHWKVILAPITIIDYIIVHELVHINIPNHSKEFWETVESIIPNYREKVNWLKINGANLNV